MTYSFHDLFLTTSVPPNATFKTFSPQHFLYLGVTVLLILVLAHQIKKWQPAKALKFVQALCILLCALYFYRFYMFSRYDYKYDFLDNLPFHLCIINQFIIPFAIFKKNKLLLNVTYTIGMPAAAIAMITPSSLYKEYHAFSWFLLFFFFVHALILLIPILAIRIDIFRPDPALYKKVVIAFLSFTAIIFTVNKIVGTNYMFINYPEMGTPMEFFANFMGNPGYLLPLFGILFGIIALMYLPWQVAEKRRQKAAMPLETIA